MEKEERERETGLFPLNPTVLLHSVIHDLVEQWIKVSHANTRIHRRDKRMGVTAMCERPSASLKTVITPYD